jgi:hypothetical protein
MLLTKLFNYFHKKEPIVELTELLHDTKVVDNSVLPSRGLFYPDDFIITLKAADGAAIEKYKKIISENNFDKLSEFISYSLKKFVSMSDGYSHNDIKIIDNLYIMLMIAKLTKGDDVMCRIYNQQTADVEYVPFDENSFAYYDFNKKFAVGDRRLNYKGYYLTIPSIGVQNSIINYVREKKELGQDTDWNFFAYSVGNLTKMTYDEIENYLDIFDDGLTDDDTAVISEGVKLLLNEVMYAVKYNGKEYDLTRVLDFENIFNENIFS